MKLFPFTFAAMLALTAGVHAQDSVKPCKPPRQASRTQVADPAEDAQQAARGNATGAQQDAQHAAGAPVTPDQSQQFAASAGCDASPPPTR